MRQQALSVFRACHCWRLLTEGMGSAALHRPSSTQSYTMLSHASLPVSSQRQCLYPGRQHTSSRRVRRALDAQKKARERKRRECTSHSKASPCLHPLSDPARPACWGSPLARLGSNLVAAGAVDSLLIIRCDTKRNLQGEFRSPHPASMCAFSGPRFYAHII